ncbi:MAG: Glu-tRNA(Gln) amidotransferase subunit GatE [Theionarchaea archaeon]|nr:Glu-tRNA(Gln) amidotransferase subunit GatE [Theionarchaea archaeon]MBU7037361.1 Glu-tRNA(Gln) amidotransferase subunit GatE [Theionarchaea archaeon]
MYEEIGLKVGLEIHQQLDTGRKLFCHCPTVLRTDEPQFEIKRRLRPSFSEKGKIDQAALAEVKKGLTFVYQGYDSVCLVELDEEPPHPLSNEAVDTGLAVSLLLRARPVDEVHTMRKIVIDGSNTSGFQRTLLLATHGVLHVEGKQYGIPTVCLEEDAARIIETRGEEKVYRLDRLGIPLIEVATDPDIRTPEEARDIALAIGQVLRATLKVKRGLGTIREDLNISIKEGSRCEIKGVQQLDLIAVYIEREVQRQLALVEIRRELEMRKASVHEGIIDVTDCFSDTKAKIIKNILERGGRVLGIILPGFCGLVGQEIQPGRRLGTEFSDRAKVVGVGGIFHSDELPAYGITDQEVSAVSQRLDRKGEDAFVLVVDEEEKSRRALEEVLVRAQEALTGVPEETREPLPDGNTRYARPLPGAERMYPETDIPSLVISGERIEGIHKELPELPHVKLKRFITEYALTPEHAEKILNSGYENVFEETQTMNLKPTLFIKVVDILKALEHEGKYIEDEHELRLCLERLANHQIVKEALDDILLKIAEGKKIKDITVEPVSREDVEDIVRKIVAENRDTIKEKGMRAVAPLMGVCMKELRGKADGKLINDILTAEIRKIAPE